MYLQPTKVLGPLVHKQIKRVIFCSLGQGVARMEALVARRVGHDVATAALAFAQRPTTRRRLDRSGLDACRIATLALALHHHLHPCLQACVPYNVEE